jgi:hypothetical protein
MEYFKPMRGPMIRRCKIIKYDESLNIYQTMYSSMIGILLYATRTRPDIIKVSLLMAIFKYTHKETHMKEVKRIFISLKDTLEFVYGIQKQHT